MIQRLSRRAFVSSLAAVSGGLAIAYKPRGAYAQQSGAPRHVGVLLLIDSAFSAVNRAHPQALYIIEDPLFFTHRRTLLKLASKIRVPIIYAYKVFAEEGALLSYGTSLSDLLRRSAGYVDKILKGARPRDLPIEQPTRFELVVNLKTAKALGITIPESTLLRADEVIR